MDDKINWIKTSERLEFVAAIQSSVTDLVQQYELIAMYDAKELPPLPESEK